MELNERQNMLINGFYKSLELELFKEKILEHRLKYLIIMIKNFRELNLNDLLDYSIISKYVFKDLSEYDYNLKNTIENYNDLINTTIKLQEAYFIGPWQMHICKECDKKFEMSFSESLFYKNKKLNIPKKCNKCRHNNKKNLVCKNCGKKISLIQFKDNHKCCSKKCYNELNK